MKSSNEYAKQFGRAYPRIPKAVFAAVAYSFVSAGGDAQDVAVANFMAEWRTLYENGIVPQKPMPEERHKDKAA